MASIQNMQRTGLNWPFLHRDLAIANVTCTCNKSQYMHESENVNIKLTKYANQLNKIEAHGQHYQDNCHLRIQISRNLF